MSNVIKVVRSVLDEIAMEGGLEIVRGALQEELEPVTAKALEDAIDKDADPWGVTPSDLKRRGVRWAKRYARFKKRVTTYNVLRWLGEDRPDLASVIMNHRKGRAWLKKHLNDIKARLWPEKDTETEKQPETEKAEETEAKPTETKTDLQPTENIPSIASY